MGLELVLSVYLLAGKQSEDSAAADSALTALRGLSGDLGGNHGLLRLVGNRALNFLLRGGGRLRPVNSWCVEERPGVQTGRAAHVGLLPDSGVLGPERDDGARARGACVADRRLRPSGMAKLFSMGLCLDARGDINVSAGDPSNIGFDVVVVDGMRGQSKPVGLEKVSDHMRDEERRSGVLTIRQWFCGMMTKILRATEAEVRCSELSFAVVLLLKLRTLALGFLMTIEPCGNPSGDGGCTAVDLDLLRNGGNHPAVLSPRTDSEVLNASLDDSAEARYPGRKPSDLSYLPAVGMADAARSGPKIETRLDGVGTARPGVTHDMVCRGSLLG